MVSIKRVVQWDLTFWNHSSERDHFIHLVTFCLQDMVAPPVWNPFPCGNCSSNQDALLLDCERGTIVLIGATTENPSFSLNNAILSRCRLVVFGKLPPEAG